MAPSFSAPTLRGAMAAATDRNQMRCERLRFEVGNLGARAARLAREMESLRREVENYRSARNDAQFEAVMSIAVGVASAASPIFAMSRVLIAIARSGGAITLKGVSTISPAIAAIVSFKLALNKLESANQNNQ